MGVVIYFAIITIENMKLKLVVGILVGVISFLTCAKLFVKSELKEAIDIIRRR